MSITESSHLGSHRLSVRKTENRKIARPSTEESIFVTSENYSEISLTGGIEYISIEKGENARIDTIEDGILSHKEYIENKENANLILSRNNPDSGEKETFVLDYNHRWTPEYRNMVYAKLKDAERKLIDIFGEGPIPVTLISLTAKQSKENGDPKAPGKVLENLLNGWENFRKAIRRATKGYRTEYIRVLEPHKSGYPHLHVAIFGVAKPSLEDKIQDLWVEKYNIGGKSAHKNSVKVARGRSAQLNNVAAYLMKYLSKTTVRESGESPTIEGFDAFSALLWVTGKRQYSASEALSGAMKRENGDDSGFGWEFIGVGYGFEEGFYDGDLAVEIIKSMTDYLPPPNGAIPGRIQTRFEW